MNRPSLPVVIGLALALGGPALLALASDRVSADNDGMATNLMAQFVMWVLLGAVLAITLKWEREPLASLGVRPLAISSVFWGLAGAVALIYGVVPIAMALIATLSLPGFEQGLSELLALPLWVRVVAVATGGVAEEVLFRGYAITRLEALSGSRIFAAAFSVSVFALAHWPLWGVGPVLTFVLSGGFLAAWFLWRRDLVANIVAHVVVDSMGLLFVPTTPSH